MAEFNYAKGRIINSLQFISQEMKEYQDEYSGKSWQVYQEDRKLQKLIDRTVENILTALIEVCGTVLTEEYVPVENYSEVLKNCGKFFGFSQEEQEKLAKLAAQRNRLAHRYLDLRWSAIRMFDEYKALIIRLSDNILEREEKKTL